MMNQEMMTRMINRQNTRATLNLKTFSTVSRLIIHHRGAILWIYVYSNLMKIQVQVVCCKIRVYDCKRAYYS